MKGRVHLRERGFTLVEVLVALLVMSLLAVMAWQGIDGMVRARDASQQRLEASLRLNTVLAQWQQDLNSLQDSVVVPWLRPDGPSFQITRRAEGGLQLVVWSLRDGRLLRWAGPAVTDAKDLQESWLRSQQLLGNEPEQVVALEGVAAWQLYCFRPGDLKFSNCYSSGDLAPAGAPAGTVMRHPPTSGVRLLLTFADGAILTRDTLLAPQP